jgi:hypothetical protein
MDEATHLVFPFWSVGSSTLNLFVRKQLVRGGGQDEKSLSSLWDIPISPAISVGDTDTVGGTVSADASRYSGSVNVAANTTTTSISFTGGTVLNAPASITDDPVWIQAKILTLNTPVAGKLLTFRLRVTDNR